MKVTQMKLRMKADAGNVSRSSDCIKLFRLIRQTNRLKISALRSLLQGFLIGSLLVGISLATVLTIWLTSTQSASTQ